MENMMAATKSVPQSKALHPEKTADRLWSIPFIGLVLFIAFYYLSPGDYFPILEGAGLNKIVAGLALVSVLWSNLSQGRPWMEFRIEANLLLLFVAVLVVGIPFSAWPGGSWGVFIESVIKTLLFVLLMTNVITSRDQLRTLVRVIVICATIIALVAVSHYVTGMFDQWGRLVGYGEKEYANPNDLALGLLMIIPLAFLLFLEAKAIFLRCVYAGVIALMSLAILASMSRTGMVGLAFLGTAWLLTMARNTPKKAIILMVVMIALVATSVAMVPALSDRFGSIFDEEKDDLGSRAARLEHMWDGLAIMAENPILGVGMGQSPGAVYARHGNSGPHWEQIHNVYLQVGAEGGIIALALFLAMIISQTLRLRRAELALMQGSDAGMVKWPRCMGASILTFIVCANFSPVAYNWFFYILLGLSGAALKLLAPQNVVEAATVGPNVSSVRLRRLIRPSGGAFSIRPSRRAEHSPASALLARSPSGLRARTPRDGVQE
jgi:putative inorganic carbon (hco3(-)) transporter